MGILSNIDAFDVDAYGSPPTYSHDYKTRKNEYILWPNASRHNILSIAFLELLSSCCQNSLGLNCIKVVCKRYSGPMLAGTTFSALHLLSFFPVGSKLFAKDGKFKVDVPRI